MAVCKTLELVQGEVKVFELTLGFIQDLENGVVEDNEINVIKNATELDDEGIRNLRRSEAGEIFETVMRLTYPDAYDEEGNIKVRPESDEDDIEDDKKKV